MDDTLKTVTVWRITRPEMYMANCPGLVDPHARQGHYVGAPGGYGREPFGLYPAAIQVAENFQEDKYLDAMAWDGPDEDHRTIYHLRVERSFWPGMPNTITMLRRSVLDNGIWQPASQLSWPRYVGGPLEVL